MDMTEYINHPERLDRDSLYELRSILALYPYFQTARLLMLQNLYLLHDPSFDEELRRAAIYITDRKVIFQLVESAHYKLNTVPRPKPADTGVSASDRTISLIDNFLGSIPQEGDSEEKKRRKPTPADAAVDYVAYLLETESELGAADDDDVPQLRGQQLIDTFIEQDRGKFVLSETPEYVPQLDAGEDEKDSDEGFFTETLARIYIQQGRYEKALDIIRRLSLNLPNKNAYFADQIRFLEKLIINSNNKTKKQ